MAECSYAGSVLAVRRSQDHFKLCMLYYGVLGGGLHEKKMQRKERKSCFANSDRIGWVVRWIWFISVCVVAELCCGIRACFILRTCIAVLISETNSIHTCACHGKLVEQLAIAAERIRAPFWSGLS
jgi:hypothetical protein